MRKSNRFNTKISTDVGKPSDKKTGGLRATNAVQLDPESPIPFEYGSQIFYSQRGLQYIPFLNPTDSFAQLLLEAKLMSPTNLLCVGTKAQYCLGQGWYFNNLEPKAYGNFTDWAKSLNRKQESLNDIIKGAFSSYFTCGNAYLEIVRGKVVNTKFVKVYKRNFLDCRLTPPDEDDIPTSVLISKEFREKGLWKTMDPNYAVEIPIYSTNIFDNSWWTDSKGFEHTIIHLRNDIEGYDYYGMPSNVASLPQQVLEYKASRYNLDNFENNLVIGGVITIKGNVTPAEAQKIGKKIIYQHSGDGKRGRFTILSSETGGVEGADIQQFDKQSEGSYIELDKHTADKIIAANDWDPFLAGIHKQSSLGSGGSTYIRSIFDIKNESVIKPAQQFMIEKFLKPLLFIADDFLGSSWSKNDMALTTVLPVSFLGDIDVNSILTKNEGREIAGYPKLEGEAGEAFIKTDSKKSNEKTDVPNQ